MVVSRVRKTYRKPWADVACQNGVIDRLYIRKIACFHPKVWIHSVHHENSGCRAKSYASKDCSRSLFLIDYWLILFSMADLSEADRPKLHGIDWLQDARVAKKIKKISAQKKIHCLSASYLLIKLRQIKWITAFLVQSKLLSFIILPWFSSPLSLQGQLWPTPGPRGHRWNWTITAFLWL